MRQRIVQTVYLPESRTAFEESCLRRALWWLKQSGMEAPRPEWLLNAVDELEEAGVTPEAPPSRGGPPCPSR